MRDEFKGMSKDVLRAVEEEIAKAREEGKRSAQFHALCPLDGRYAEIAERLDPYFSEYALVEHRVWVEVQWLMFLKRNIKSSILSLNAQNFEFNNLISIYANFSEEDFLKVKEIERTTRHDVKSVELFVAEKLSQMGADYLRSYVHIGCTSEDITNCAYAKMISSAMKEVWIPAAKELISLLKEMAKKYKDIPMLAHTHGQPATPTTVGKEILVFAARLESSFLNLAMNYSSRAKFNGATGNYAAINTAFPEEDWTELAKSFVENYLHLNFNPITTQIENHDYMSHILDGIRHFNNVLRDLDLDMWLYISKEYFKQEVVQNEVGSSTMPHKVNPIRFENSEANIKMANAICSSLSEELPRSRMQRDLSDSSLQRNIGMAFGYSLQAIEQTIAGLKKVMVNEEKLAQDLNEKWEVLAEPIQTMLRKYGISDAYDRLKKLTRGKGISKESLHDFINSLDELSEEDKKTLLDLTPATYVGLASEIVSKTLSPGDTDWYSAE